MGGERGQGLQWKGVDSNARCDKTRQNSFFFPNEKEKKVVQDEKEEGRKRGRGQGAGGVGRGASFSKVL